MRGFRQSVGILLALLISVPAIAGGVPLQPVAEYGNCREYLLCSGETTPRVCGGSGSERYVTLGTGNSVTAFAHESTNTTESWNVYFYSTAPGMGYHPTKRTAISSTEPLTKDYLKASWTCEDGDVHGQITGTLTTGTIVIRLKVCDR